MGTYSKNVVRLALVVFFILLLVGLAAFTFLRPGWLGNIAPGSQGAAVALVDLSSSGNFAILAGAGITNTGATSVTGDVGSYATLTQTGFGPGADSVTLVSTSTNHFGDAATQAAKTALTAAYNFAEAEGPTSPIVADLGGQTLGPGIYNSASTIGLTGTLTLDGGGNPDAVFVFQAGSALTTLSGSSINLINGAQACNIFWQVGSDATLGTNSTFRGTLMALSSITVTTGVTIEGRVLAQNGAVTLDTNTIALPTTCVSASPASATLHIIKSVINVSGTATPSDFMVHVKSATSTLDVAGSPAAGASTPGTLYTLAAGAYTVSEGAHPSFPTYTQTFGLDCVGGSFTLAPGEDKICTVINTDIPPPPPVVMNSGGGTGSLPAPLIALTKIPSPLSLPGGSGPVTYTYAVKNIGTVAMSGVSVKDDKCSPTTFVSGDDDSNSMLGTNETWKYVCTKTVSATETNTATAHGYANNLDVYAVALATVVVGASSPPPLIAITKVPSRLTPFPFGGGVVTYSYTVTNPGVVALHDVAVTDDKCASVSRVSGDTNGDTLLDLGETWVYTCRANISVSTRNIATAVGKANGIIALGYAFATVLVSAPGLPNAGLPPRNTIDDKTLKAIQAIARGQVRQGLPRLKIPAINVDTSLESVGLTQEGAVDVPKSPANAGWLDLGPRPGESGNAIIVGHYGWKDDVPAVFDDLHALRKGDTLYIEDEKGVTTTFRVRGLHIYEENESAAGAFFSNDGGSHLVLITCDGVWNETTKTYSGRLVVFADKE